MKLKRAIIASMLAGLAAIPAQGLLAQAALQRLVPPSPPQQRAALPTYEILQFRFGTGDDDLRSDSHLFATVTFPDGSTQKCELHGDPAQGGEANISWDNGTTHESAPCHLSHGWNLRDLKRTKIELNLDAIGGGIALGTGNDNWNINTITVEAYNSGNPERGNLFCYRGDPMLVRMTGSMSKITVTDLPTTC